MITLILVRRKDFRIYLKESKVKEMLKLKKGMEVDLVKISENYPLHPKIILQLLIYSKYFEMSIQSASSHEFWK